MLDTCQHKYVLQSLQKSIRRDISVIFLNFTALLVRLAQTITKILGIKYRDFCFQERKVLLFYLHTLQYVAPLLLIAPSWGFSQQLSKSALFPDLRYYKT